MPLMLINNWKYIIIASLSIWIYALKSDLKVETALKEGVISALTAQSNILESNRVDYEHNLIDANKTNTVIHTRYKERIQVIYQWGDNNATCDDAMYDINHYQY